ncbi:DpnD/PcfM family protein [Leuconostoc pseudomesenteroides]|jgi:hypothetical protein|uniref:DpnD/PcfM family protein n=1 Tax=Leuconostoc pseudomesenteroides TaxID=33968 RepID=UPI0039EAC791
MTYTIEVTATLTRWVDVEADDFFDARDQVQQQYYEGKIPLDDNDLSTTEFNRVP